MYKKDFAFISTCMQMGNSYGAVHDGDAEIAVGGTGICEHHAGF